MFVTYGKNRNEKQMFRAFGTVIVLWYLSTLFVNSFSALDAALSASFKTLEATAIVSREHITNQQ